MGPDLDRPGAVPEQRSVANRGVSLQEPGRVIQGGMADQSLGVTLDLGGGRVAACEEDVTIGPGLIPPECSHELRMLLQQTGRLEIVPRKAVARTEPGFLRPGRVALIAEEHRAHLRPEGIVGLGTSRL